MVAALVPLAAAMLVSGIDDLLVDAVWLAVWLKRKVWPEASVFPPGARQLETAPVRRVAILVPLWREHEVIGRMLEHTCAAIRYPDYHIFAGAYPNDQPTQAAVRAACARFKHVHLAVCPHDGPTSKADCLNWVYQHMCLYEEQTGQSFEIVVTHDAEDLIHPEELRWINFYTARFDFVQTPVLALKTPLHSLTHGVYCDEFAEYHSRDMTVRAAMGGFVPGAGVGTGYRRDALERLAEAASNRLFEPDALTEDYENGLRLFRLGCSQGFIPIARANGKPHDFVATREFFPARWTAALRQRTRWVMGIALQSWERNGWRGRAIAKYWLWRDRKGLIGNPLSLVANAVFVYGLTTAIWTRATPLAARLTVATLALQLLRTTIRMGCVARVYGSTYALGVPVRSIYANVLNSAAVGAALARYAVARARNRRLEWLKTDHQYPSRVALLAHKRLLGEILAGSGYLSEQGLRVALAAVPSGTRLGEFLVANGQISEGHLYEALSLQQGLPVCHLTAAEVPRRALRALPLHVAREWKVLPFKIAENSLYVAGPGLPTQEMTDALRGFTSLELRFHLITPSEFEKVATASFSAAA
jgi:adsorption protein B